MSAYKLLKILQALQLIRSYKIKGTKHPHNSSEPKKIHSIYK